MGKYFWLETCDGMFIATIFLVGIFLARVFQQEHLLFLWKDFWQVCFLANIFCRIIFSKIFLVGVFLAGIFIATVFLAKYFWQKFLAKYFWRKYFLQENYWQEYLLLQYFQQNIFGRIFLAKYFWWEQQNILDRGYFWLEYFLVGIFLAAAFQTLFTLAKFIAKSQSKMPATMTQNNHYCPCFGHLG